MSRCDSPYFRVIAVLLITFFNLGPNKSLHSYNNDLHLNRHFIIMTDWQKCFSTKEDVAFSQALSEIFSDVFLSLLNSMHLICMQ